MPLAISPDLQHAGMGAIPHEQGVAFRVWAPNGDSGWFDDAEALEWHRRQEFAGILQLYRDLIRLRRNVDQTTAGLTGQNVRGHHANELDKLIAFHRWVEGGPADDVIVIANCANAQRMAYRVGLPRAGTWKLRLNSGAKIYAADLVGETVLELHAVDHPHDGYPHSGEVAIGPYSVLIYSQDKRESD